jgi:putative PIN family toxin of toxin-antitoxin system
MRLVLDTNVLARVVISPKGLAAELFDRVRLEHILVSSAEMLAELTRVLSYDRLRKLHRLDDRAIEDFVRYVERGSALVGLPADIPSIVAADPDDDVVVATQSSVTRMQSARVTATCLTPMSSHICPNGRSRSSTTCN